jgi:hypothetical protein
MQSSSSQSSWSWHIWQFSVLAVVCWWQSSCTFCPSRRDQTCRCFHHQALEPLALTLNEPDFSLADLRSKATDLLFKYRKEAQWKSFEDEINALTKNSTVYLGDFLLFLLAWFVLFKFLPEASWTKANAVSFCPVAAMALGLALLARVRVSRALATVPYLLLVVVAQMVRTDPAMKALFEAPKEKVEHVRFRLEELLHEERMRPHRQPSLLAFLYFKFGYRRVGLPEPRQKRNSGFPFTKLYKYGLQFALDEKWQTSYDTDWLRHYCAYVYYRFHNAVTGLAKFIWQLIRYAVTGAL